jgi:hypothetical protein
MPNGVDKNLYRLRSACASYRAKYHEWPSQARLQPLLLWDIAQVLDAENFDRLAAHLELRTRDAPGLSVGGRGVVEYGGDDVDGELLDLAEKWLGVEVRRDVRR